MPGPSVAAAGEQHDLATRRLERGLEEPDGDGERDARAPQACGGRWRRARVLLEALEGLGELNSACWTGRRNRDAGPMGMGQARLLGGHAGTAGPPGRARSIS